MHLCRLYQILVAFKSYRILELLPKRFVPKKLKWILLAVFWVKNKAKHKSEGQRVQLCFEELGPIWIKFGQLLSTRQDLLSQQMAKSLANLQDQVAPFSGELAKQEIEKSLNAPLSTYFKEFDTQPLASASIAQVHSAILKKGDIPIVIKVVRPNIEALIQKDLKLMLFLAHKLENKSPHYQKLHPVEIVLDYQKTILNELNLEREAFNTKKLRDHFINSEMLYVPYVYDDFSHPNIMVSERIFAVPISDIDTLKSQNVNLKLLAERGVDVFFQQVFRDNFFHADMHPGNIFVNISNPIDPSYIGIDCAIMGVLTHADQTFLAQTFIAFFNRDYQAIANYYIDAGWVPETTDVFLLQSTFKRVYDPFFNKSLGEISFAQVLLELFKVARQFEIEVQPQLVLLQKTLFYVEGLGRQLYPKLDLWKTAKPYLENWYKAQYHPRTIAKQLKQDLPHWRNLILEFPAQWQQEKKEQLQLKKQILDLKKQLTTNHKRQKNWFLTLFVLILITLFFIIFI